MFVSLRFTHPRDPTALTSPNAQAPTPPQQHFSKGDFFERANVKEVETVSAFRTRALG